MSQSEPTFPTGLSSGLWSHVTVRELVLEDNAHLLLLSVNPPSLYQTRLHCIAVYPSQITVPYNNKSFCPVHAKSSEQLLSDKSFAKRWQ